MKSSPFDLAFQTRPFRCHSFRQRIQGSFAMHLFKSHPKMSFDYISWSISEW